MRPREIDRSGVRLGLPPAHCTRPALRLYASPVPNALSPTFESPFAWMEYVGDGKFNLAYLRHTGKCWEVYRGLTADDRLKTIRDGAIFQP